MLASLHHVFHMHHNQLARKIKGGKYANIFGLVVAG